MQMLVLVSQYERLFQLSAPLLGATLAENGDLSWVHTCMKYNDLV